MSDAIGRVSALPRLAVAAGLAAMLAAAAQAQAPAQAPAGLPEPETFTFGAWLVSCFEEAGATALCELSQRVLSDADSLQILAVTLIATPNAQPTEVVFTTPLGVWLEPGALLGFAGSERALPLVFERCAPDGCFVYAAFDDDLRTQFSAGGFAELRFADRLRQPLAVPIALDGFAEALAKLEAETAPKSRGVWGWLRRIGGPDQ